MFTSELNPQFFTLGAVVFSILVILLIDDKKISTIVSRSNSLFLNKLSDIDGGKYYFRKLFVFLTLLTIILQGQYLDFETIDADVHTYLLLGNDVLNGFLPYENQWDDKGPIFYIFYALLIFLSNKNLIIFKILCDLLLLLIAFGIAKIIYTNKGGQRKVQAFFGSSFFVLLLSTPWGSVEYSELFCLFFICPSFYLIVKNDSNKRDVFFSGILYGLSTLINQGSGVFVVIFIYLIYKLNKLSNFGKFVSGFIAPHIIIFTLYAVRNLLDIYFSTLVIIPLKYSRQSFNLVNELIVFFRETLFYDPFLYLVIIFLIILSIFQIKNINIELFPYIGIFLSLIFFFLGSAGYKHHLIFFLFFICLIPISNSANKKSYYWIVVVLLILSTASLTPESSKKSFSNLIDIEKTYSNYPLRNLANEIDKQFDKNFTIFSLDHSLILFYLDKKNESYIIHPTNYAEPSIFNELVRIGKIAPKELPLQISRKPNVIICSQEIRELLVDVNCEVTDFYKGYEKIDTNLFFNSSKRTFYKDPYRSIDLYVKRNIK
tara:strand:- start:1274 stop:2908 length:1635 start_codon:yes stop_codon:yes gene_type:complete